MKEHGTIWKEISKLANSELANGYIIPVPDVSPALGKNSGDQHPWGCIFFPGRGLVTCNLKAETSQTGASKIVCWFAWVLELLFNLPRALEHFQALNLVAA